MKRSPGSRRPTPASRAPVRLPGLSRQASAARPKTAPTAAADDAVAQGVPLHQAGRLHEAEACYRQALTLDPTHPEALHLLGLLAHQVGRPEIAVQLIQQAIARAADRPSYHLNLGAVLQALGRLEEAVTACRQALALRSAYPEAFNNLGVILQALDRLEQAIPCFEQAIGLAPAYADAHFNLGVARQAQDRPDLAVGCYQEALRVRAAYPAAQYNLGNALRELGQPERAAEAYRAVLALDPGHFDAQNNLGVVLQDLGDRDGAIECFERTIALRPEYAQAHTNLAHLLRDRGRFDEAIQAYRRALALQPDDIQAHSGLILVLDHHEGATPADRLAERRAWNERHARALMAAAPPHTPGPATDRPLRVGYVSGDFFYHSASSGFAPVILNHDPAQIEAVCYATITRTDAQTARFKAGVPHWRDVTSLSDEAVADLIRADEIDILVDLGGHSASGRLRIFAHKPAPVQVTAWGYITGTGLDAVDYLLADPVALPPEAEQWYSERVVHLPSIVCYEPAANLPPVAPPPILERGAVTFGSFNRATKLSDDALDLWGRVVATVPGSRMILKSPGLNDPENQTRILAAFARHGVGPERVEILGQTPLLEHIAAYSRIDVQLDPFPHVGGATTFEGLMQGVPCVTLLGELIQGRLSASFLTQLGLTDLIAQTPDEYVVIAARLAADPDRLTRERETLRERLLAAPLADGPGYTRAVEALYRELWQQWCDGEGSPSPARGRGENDSPSPPQGGGGWGEGATHPEASS
ncbi:MAG: tetratricopeptide repeat protein [Chloroflexota bacterium]